MFDPFYGDTNLDNCIYRMHHLKFRQDGQPGEKSVY